MEFCGGGLWSACALNAKHEAPTYQTSSLVFLLHFLWEKLNCFSCPLDTNGNSKRKKRNRDLILTLRDVSRRCEPKRVKNGMKMFVLCGKISAGIKRKFNPTLKASRLPFCAVEEFSLFIHAMMNASFNLRISIVQSFIEKRVFHPTDVNHGVQWRKSPWELLAIPFPKKPQRVVLRLRALNQLRS